MKILISIVTKIALIIIFLSASFNAYAWESNPNKLAPCPELDNTRFVDTGLNGRTANWNNCWGRYTRQLDKQKKGNTIEGEWQKGAVNGYAFAVNVNGDTYEGEFVNGKFHGRGIYIFSDGKKIEGIWENGDLIQKTKINFGFLKKITDQNLDQSKTTTDNISRQINLFDVKNTSPNFDGEFLITIKTHPNINSLKINGEEHGSSKDGTYSIRKFSRAGQETHFNIEITDTYGNVDAKTIIVSRPVSESKTLVAALNPAQVKKQPERDAVAVIIGIADYKNLPRADFANDDARMFYDYAIRALGVKPENIRLLVDGDADEVGIYRAFKTWLPSRVRASTDVYVFYSGHGLPTADGQGLYVLPQRADRDFIDKTAITQAEINAAIQAAKPRSVTVFLDACYSGQARTGETLLASARPVALKAERQLFPDSFTVISASQADQISSSSPDLKHGIFSYYLMRGMEGDADVNRDGKITAGEMHTYLTEQVARQAGMMNRQQVPQLTGDANRVLVGR
jgi:hypothetical protein